MKASLRKLPVIFDFLAELNLAMFYIQGRYHTIAQRIFGIRFVSSTTIPLDSIHQDLPHRLQHFLRIRTFELLPTVFSDYLFSSALLIKPIKLLENCYQPLRLSFKNRLSSYNPSHLRRIPISTPHLSMTYSRTQINILSLNRKTAQKMRRLIGIHILTWNKSHNRFGIVVNVRFVWRSAPNPHLQNAGTYFAGVVLFLGLKRGENAHFVGNTLNATNYFQYITYKLLLTL
jgi:hypothetical protein